MTTENFVPVELRAGNTYPISRSNTMPDTIAEIKPDAASSNVDKNPMLRRGEDTGNHPDMTGAETSSGTAIEPREQKIIDARVASWESASNVAGKELTDEWRAEIRVLAEKGVMPEVQIKDGEIVLGRRIIAPEERVHLKERAVERRVQAWIHTDRAKGNEPSIERLAEIRSMAEQGRAPEIAGGAQPPLPDRELQNNPEFFTELHHALSDAGVQAELALNNPNLGADRMRPLKEFMEKHVKGSDATYTYFAEVIALGDVISPAHTAIGSREYRLDYAYGTPAVGGGGGRPSYDMHAGDIRVSERARELLFEWTVERMIGIPDYGPEEAHYDIGRSLQLQSNQDEVKQLAHSYFHETGFGVRMHTLMEVRPIMHELRRIVNNSEEYTKYLGGLAMYNLDFVRNKTPGVDQVIESLETAANYRVSIAGRAFSDEDIQLVEKEVRTKLEHLMRRGQLKDDTGRPLTEWELERALKFGQAYFAGMQRYGVYTGLGELPGQTTGRVGSLPYEYIVRKLQGIKATALRYWGNEGPSGYFLRNIFKEVAASEKNNNRTKSIYGISKDVMYINNEYTIFDLIDSHSWRSLLTYMGNIDISMPDGRGGSVSRPLLEYLNNALVGNGAEVDPALGIVGEGDTNGISNDMRDLLLGQSLFLSTFVRNVPINAELKGMIWQKMATLSPLTLAAIRPEMLTEAQKQMMLEGRINGDNLPIRAKMAIAQQMRVKRDQERYFDERGEVRGQDIGAVTAEADRYKNLIRIEDRVRQLGLRALNQSDAEFYRNAVGGSMDLDASGYQRLLRLDGAIVNAGVRRMNPRERAVYASSRADKYRILEFFNDTYGNQLTGDEANLVRHIIDSGFILGKDMGSTRLPYTTGIDDSPKVALRKRGIGAGIAGLGDANLIRVVGDQVTYGEGFTAMNTWIEHPAEKYAEQPIEMNNNWLRIIGRHASQQKTAIVVGAFAEGTVQRAAATWFGSFMKDRQIPRSDWEKFFPRSNLAWDPDQRQEYFRKLGQQGGLDTQKKLVKNKDGSTKKTWFGLRPVYESMVDSLEKKKKARETNVRILSIIQFLQVLLPEFVVQMFKGAIFNKENVKDVA